MRGRLALSPTMRAALDLDTAPRPVVSPAAMPATLAVTADREPTGVDPHIALWSGLGPRRTRRARERLAEQVGCPRHGEGCPLLTDGR